MNNVQTFSQASGQYARFRPQYPPELFSHLSGLCASHERAWDCATGNGQAAVSLAEYFLRVDATDLSRDQILRGPAHPRVRYQACLAEQTSFTNSSFDLVTVAQAIHWFDKPRFLREVDRVLRPGGIFAVWGYGTLEMEAPLQHILQVELMRQIDPFWAEGNRELMDGYKDLALPFAKIEIEREFAINVQWDLPQFASFLRTWSAVKRYETELGVDPVLKFEEAVKKEWKDPRQPVKIKMPLSLKISRKS